MRSNAKCFAVLCGVVLHLLAATQYIWLPVKLDKRWELVAAVSGDNCGSVSPPGFDCVVLRLGVWSAAAVASPYERYSTEGVPASSTCLAHVLRNVAYTCIPVGVLGKRGERWGKEV